MELAAVLIVLAFVIIFCGPALAATLGRSGLAMLRAIRRTARNQGRQPTPSKE